MRMNMKAERARCGLSASEAAKRIVVSTNTLLRWESVENTPLSENFITAHLITYSVWVISEHESHVKRINTS